MKQAQKEKEGDEKKGETDIVALSVYMYLQVWFVMTGSKCTVHHR
jgi:hypothetical protein